MIMAKNSHYNPRVGHSDQFRREHEAAQARAERDVEAIKQSLLRTGRYSL